MGTFLCFFVLLPLCISLPSLKQERGLLISLRDSGEKVEPVVDVGNSEEVEREDKKETQRRQETETETETETEMLMGIGF